MSYLDFGQVLGPMAVNNNPNKVQQILDIIGSKGGQTVTNAVGAALQSYGAGKQAEADRAATAQQFRANMAQREYEGDQADARARSTAALDASPLGQDQAFAQKMAITRAILGSARNPVLTPGDPRVAKAMGTSTGGIRIPEGGFDPAMLDRLFGDQATQASIAQHAKSVGRVDPGAPAPALAELYPGSDGQPNPYLADVASANAGVQAQMDAASQRRRDIIQRAIDEDIKGEKQGKKKSTGSRLAGAASGAASGAAMGSMFGPVGTAIGGGLGFLKGLF